ncbi:MAG: hypothetical protein IT368_13115, partial [Candidatus Hydrogenedentes bacterium]|nr:hypothetical protein [Candidatus Hydrogenedentota bacterium]
MLRARLLPAASRIWQYLCICIPLLLAGTSQAQDGPYNNSFLDGLYFPQDIFTLLTGDGATGIGARDFDGDDRLSSIVTFGTRTPLTYEVRDDGRFRLYDDEIDWGFAGSIGLGGDLLVFSPQAARREDLQITEGYAGLRISTVESGSWGDSDFKGSYSYHALLFKGDDWFSETGAVEADGNGRMTLLRAGTPALNLSYDVGGNGRVVIDGGNPQRASITADGDVVIHVLDVGRNDDPLHPAGYEGLALYVRRKSTTTAIPREWLSGTYQVHQLRVSTPTTPLASTGTVTAGGNFTFFGTLGGVAYADHLKVYPTGVFELSNQDTWTGTLTAGGDVAVVSAASGIPRLQIWLRTAGGSALPGDRDGDGVRDDRESARGTDLNRADTDGDGLLDNVDTRPATADNRFTAVLDADEFSVTEGATTPIETSLILDSNDFPFFDWSVASDADWLTIDPAKGSGDKSLKLTIDPTELTSADSPSVATLTVTAPNMQAVAPLELVVNVEPTPVTLALTPTSLTFTAVEGASPPPARSVALSSTDATTFAWTATATAAWLKVTPVNGNGPATLSVEVNPAALSTAASPFTGSVQVSLAGASTPSASTQVTLNLLPRRDPGLAWRVSPTGTAQDDPAADADSETGRWVLAWQENSQIVSLVLAADGTPLAGPLPVSLAIQGTAVAPQVVVAPGEGFAWIFWQQNNTGSVSSIQARRWNLDSLVLSNVFGIAGGRTGRSAPHAVLSGDGKEVVVAYELAQDIGSAIEWTRLNASTNTAIESRILWQSNDRLAAPRIAAAPNGYLVAAAIQRFDGSSSGVWARLLGNGGAPVGEPIALDTGDAFADMPVPAYAGLPSAYPRVAAYPWHIAWRQRSSVTSQDTDYILGRLSPNGTVSREPLGSGSAFGHTQTAASLPEQSQFIYQTTAEPVGILRRRITTGGFLLDTPLAYPQGAGSQRHPGVAYSIGANEFLTLWQDLRHGHGQIYALREDAGSTDEDGDGLSNDWELTFDLSPFNADGDNGAAGDPDLDGLTNTDEYRMQTNPTKRDSDDDGLWDRQEDRDRDGVLDPGESSPSDADTDDDGFRD